MAEALELVQLSGYEKRRPNQLSGGQQQRVALARALVLRPSVLLLDEPLGALDAKLRRTLQVELGALQEQVGITFLYVTHDQEEALTMSDRLAVMNHGRIAQLGTPEEVYNEPADAYVADFLGVSNLMDAQVAARRRRRGALPPAHGRLHARGRGRPARRHRRGQARDPSRARPRASPTRRSGANRVPGMVERLVFLGSTTQVYVRLATGSALQTLVRNDGAELPYSQGTAVSVAIPADALRVLPDPGVSVAEIRDETVGDQRARPDRHQFGLTAAAAARLDSPRDERRGPAGGQARLRLRRVGGRRQDDDLGGDRAGHGRPRRQGRGGHDRPGQAAGQRARARGARERAAARGAASGWRRPGSRSRASCGR